MQRQIFACLALLTIILTVYWGVDGHGFVPARDPQIVGDPYLLDGLTWKGLRHLWGDDGRSWQPLARLSFMVDIQFQGISAAAFHRTNLLLHIGNVLLAYGLLYRISREFWPSLLAAVFFACQPIHVEAVAWISSRSVLLASFFALLSLHAYWGYRRERGIALYLLTSLLYGMTLLASGLLWPLPFVFCLLDFWPYPNPVSTQRIMLEKLPMFGIGVVLGFLHSVNQGMWLDPTYQDRLPFAASVSRGLTVCTNYVCRLVWPVGLTPYYPPLEYPQNVGKTVESGLFVLVVSWFALREVRRYPFLLAGWLWFLIGIFPVIGVLPLRGELLSDRYAYFPYLGLYILASWLICQVYARSRDSVRLALGLAVGMCIVLFVTMAQWQCSYWASGESLFQHSLSLSKQNGKAHQYLGQALIDQNKLADGLAELAEARKLRPGDIEILNDLARSLMNSGRLVEAREQLRAALDLDPNRPETYLNLGRLDRIEGAYAMAIERLQTALRLRGDLVAARLELGACYAEIGQLPEAVRQHEIALETQNDFVVHERFGRILFLARDFDGALKHFGIALALRPDSAVAHSNRAAVLTVRGDNQAAEAWYDSALSREPNLVEAHRGLALLLARTGRLKEANAHFQAAQRLSPADTQMAQYFAEIVLNQLDAVIARYSETIRLHPDDGIAHGQLAHAYAARQKSDKAIEHLRVALKLKPDWLDGANNLAWMLATLNKSELRNGSEAVKWASMVCDRTGHGNVEYLDTLAAAFAESGDYSQAVRTAESALQLAKASGQKNLATAMESRVKLYRSHQPYREESTAAGLP